MHTQAAITAPTCAEPVGTRPRVRDRVVNTRSPHLSPLPTWGSWRVRAAEADSAAGRGESHSSLELVVQIEEVGAGPALQRPREKVNTTTGSCARVRRRPGGTGTRHGPEAGRGVEMESLNNGGQSGDVKQSQVGSAQAPSSPRRAGKKDSGRKKGWQVQSRSVLTWAGPP